MEMQTVLYCELEKPENQVKIQGIIICFTNSSGICIFGMKIN